MALKYSGDIDKKEDSEKEDGGNIFEVLMC